MKGNKMLIEKRMFEAIKQECFDDGMKTAWELARMILHGLWDQTAEIFDLDIYEMTPQTKVSIIDTHTPQEVKEKIAAWEARRKQEIKVGDVVEHHYNDCSGIVLDICDEETFHVLTENGCVETWCFVDVVNTNTSVDVQGLIMKIGGAD